MGKGSQKSPRQCLYKMVALGVACRNAGRWLLLLPGHSKAFQRGLCAGWLHLCVSPEGCQCSKSHCYKPPQGPPFCTGTALGAGATISLQNEGPKTIFFARQSLGKMKAYDHILQPKMAQVFCLK